MVSRITVRAPSSTANLGPGFDVFGLAVDAFFDEVTLARQDRGRGITVVAGGSGVPTDPEKNTAGLVVKNMKKRFGITGGVEIRIKKGVPPGFGLGSSAASAAAAAVAADRLFGLGLDGNSLVGFAGSGEKASAGSVHYDNVAASVLGGFVIVRTDPLDVVRVSPPANLRMCVAIPKLDVPEKKTEVSRGVVPARIRLADSVANLSNAAAVVAGFMKKDPRMIGTSVRDAVVEPARAHMIPGFGRVKENALKAGAHGVTISGAGPSVIAFSEKAADLAGIAGAMSRGFASAGTDCRTVVCGPAKGARIRR